MTSQQSKPPKVITLDCAKHTHRGRDYLKGDTITVPAHSAEWLIGRRRAHEASAPAVSLNAPKEK